MKSVLLALVLLLALDLSDSLILRGTRKRQTAATLREYQKRKQQSSNKRNTFPDFPREPLVTNVDVGTPTTKRSKPATFRLAVETGQPNMWTLSPAYPALSSDNQSYDPKKSKTSKNLGYNASALSRTFELDGKMYNDIVKMDKQTVFYQSFLQVDKTKSDDPEWTNPKFDEIDGVLGLSWVTTSKSEDSCCDLSQLKPRTAAKEVQKYHVEPIRHILDCASTRYQDKFYVLWVSNHPTSEGTCQTPEYDWQISFAQEDNEHCSANYMQNQLVASKFSTPVFMLEKFTFDMWSYESSTSAASVDSGSAVILLNDDSYSQVIMTVNPFYDFDTGIYTVDCKNAAKYEPMIFTVNTIEYVVPSSSYVVDVGLDDGQCALAIGVSEEQYTLPWVLGIPFTQNYCVRFDVGKNQIGFAEHKTSSL